MTIAGEYRFVPRDIIVRSKIDKGSARLRILGKVINSPRGITADELELRLGLKSSTVSSALNAMVGKGMVVDSGERRPTRSGRAARVYVRRVRK